MVVTHSVVPCGHMFCGECLSTWLQRTHTCPKCRSAATAPPVRAIAVDNILETLVEKTMSAEDLQHRQQRKQHWQSRAASIEAKMKGLFQQPVPIAFQPGRGQPLPPWEYQALANQARQQAMDGMRGESNTFCSKLAGAERHPHQSSSA